jgi:predicted N-acetyltransferase YhbS
MSIPSASGHPVLVRPLAEEDLEEADRIARVAFGTFLGMPHPEKFFGDADFIRTRWRANPVAALAAEIDGRLVGSNFAGNWGSVGFFGPLTVEPTVWDRAIGRRLMDATMELLDRWGTAHVGLFTFAQSAKHVGLYQRYGFWPRFLTGIFSARVTTKGEAAATRLSELNVGDRLSAIESIRALTDAIHPGLDLGVEIDAVEKQGPRRFGGHRQRIRREWIYCVPHRSRDRGRRWQLLHQVRRGSTRPKCRSGFPASTPGLRIVSFGQRRSRPRGRNECWARASVEDP